MKNVKQLIKENDITVIDCCHNAGSISGAVEEFIEKNKLAIEFVRPSSKRYDPARGDFRNSTQKKDGTKVLFFDEDNFLKKEIFISVVENELLQSKKVGEWEFAGFGLEVCIPEA